MFAVSVVRCLLFVGCFPLLVVRRVFVVCLLCVVSVVAVRCAVLVGRCVLSVVWCCVLVCGVRCSLAVVRCVVFVVCWLPSGVCCVSVRWLTCCWLQGVVWCALVV